MITFTSSEKQIIQKWLNGSHDYFTRVSLVARWNTKIPSDSLVESGETLDSRTGLSTSANPQRDMELIQNSPLPQEQEITTIYDVRFKRSGLKQDMSFRSPTLTFTWSDYYGFIQGKEQKAIRFYLKVSLIGGEISGELVLLKTGFYKIRKAEAVYSTSKSSGADYTIEAVPWIYEYNDEMMFGTHGNGWMQPAYDQWDINTWDRNIAYFGSWNSISRLQKIKHDLKNIKVANYPAGPAEYFDDSPCSYTGPFYCKEDGGQITWLSFSKMGMQRVFGFVDETPISMLQRYYLKYFLIVPEVYKDDSPLDTPMITFLRLEDRLSWGDSGSFPEENSFDEIESSDQEVTRDSLYSYSYMTYSMSLLENVFAFWQTATVSLDTGISGVIELSDLYFRDNQNAEGLGKEDYPRKLISRVTAYGSSENSLGITGQFESNGDVVRVLYLPGNVSENIYKLEVQSYYGRMTSSSSDVETDNQGDVVHIDIDTKTNLYDSLVDQISGKLSVFYIYSNRIKRAVKFSAEFRPWINVFDPIRLRVMDSFGQRHWLRCLVTDIDVNIDSFSASYEAMVIKEEENE